MKWLIPGRVAAADDMAEPDASVHTVLLLGRAARGPAMGRSPRGHWVMDRQLRRASRPSLCEIQGVVDFLRYEREVGRAVAIIARPRWLADVCVECLAVAEGSRRRWRQALTASYAKALRRDGEQRIRRRGGTQRGLLRKTLVHTTSVEALPSIIRDGALKCFALCKSARDAVAIGTLVLKEPDDYGDYAMFNASGGGFRGGISGEIVVNSRRIGDFWSPDRARNGDYVPGVRMYFSRERLESHPDVCFDGVHALKIRGQVELAGYLLAVATADRTVAAACASLGVPILRPKANTPEQYVAESNRLFVRAMIRAGVARDF